MSRHPRVRPLRGTPTVSVIVPCYNYGHYLPVALASVLDQPEVEVEAIVIDDASPDGSAGVVRKLAAADERVRPILHRRNRGHIATYNEGLEQARGEYVVLLSADDALAPGALARATALMEAEPSVGFVYGFPVEFADELPPAGRKVRSWTVWSGAEWIERSARAGRNFVMCPEVVMRACIQKTIGGYDPELPHSGDLDMWLRAASISNVGRVNGPAQAYYRVHAASMQRTVHTGHLVDLEGRLAAFEKVLGGGPADGGEVMLAAARQALARAALGYARSAHAHGRAELEPVDEYLAFAARVWPEARPLRHARARRQALVRGLHRLAEDLGARARWRRWRWSGV